MVLVHADQVTKGGNVRMNAGTDYTDMDVEAFVSLVDIRIMLATKLMGRVPASTVSRGDTVWTIVKYPCTDLGAPKCVNAIWILSYVVMSMGSVIIKRITHFE